EERLAWARANGVEPPDYAERPSGSGWQSVRVRDQIASKTTTCCACRKPTAKSARPRPGNSCCTDGEASLLDESSNRSANDRTPAKKTWVRGVDVLRCHSLSTIWVSSGGTSPPPPIVVWHPSWPFAGQILDRELIGHIRAHTPPEPPPRSI